MGAAIRETAPARARHEDREERLARDRTPLSHPSTRIRTDVRSHDLASLNTLRTRRTVRTPIRTWVRVGTTRNRLAERGRRWIDGGGNPGDGSRAGEARGPRGAPGP